MGKYLSREQWHHRRYCSHRDVPDRIWRGLSFWTEGAIHHSNEIEVEGAARVPGKVALDRRLLSRVRHAFGRRTGKTS